MGIQTFERTTTIHAPASELFAWHLRPGAFERLQAPGDGTRVVSRSGRLEDNTMRVVLSVVALGPIRQQLHIRHEGFVPDEQFVDVMERGPFASWRHTHRAEVVDHDTSRLVDRIEYALPLGVLGRIGGGAFVRRMLTRMFDHRHAITQGDLAVHHAAALEPMHVLVDGPASDVRDQLVAALLTGGHHVQSEVEIAGYEPPAATPPDVAITLAPGSATIARTGSATRTVALDDDPMHDPRTIVGALAELAAEVSTP